MRIENYLTTDDPSACESFFVSDVPMISFLGV